MSKGNRIKKARLLAAPPKRWPENMLLEGVLAVGDIFGDEADCVRAAALLQGTAKQLGYLLQVRPVSVVAKHAPSNTVAVMGPRATALFAKDQLKQAENHLPGGKNNGHVVLTCEEPRLLIDANLRQLGASGFPAPSMVVRVKSTHPESGGWVANPGDWNINYLLDEDNDALVSNFRQVQLGVASTANYLASRLKNGATAATLYGEIKRPE